MTQPLTATRHYTRTQDIPTERTPYPQLDPEFHRWDEGPHWCRNEGDPHPAGPDECGTPIGFMERGSFFASVSVWRGKVTLSAAFDENESDEVDPADARLIAQWLTTAAELVEGLAD